MYVEQSAGQGYAGGMYGFGQYYLAGKGGLERNASKAMRLFQESADQGYAPGLYAVGLHNMAVTRLNKERGFQYLLAAADQHHCRALSRVARCYYEGEGVAADIIEAVRYLRRAEKLITTVPEYSVFEATIARQLEQYAPEYKAQVSDPWCHFLHVVCTNSRILIYQPRGMIYMYIHKYICSRSIAAPA